MNKVLRIIVKNKRTLLTIGSYVLGFLSFGKIWKKRHEIDAVLDDTIERRRSEDKKVRREAKIETAKRLFPLLVGSVLGVAGSLFLGFTAHKVASAEIANACATAESMSRIVASSACVDKDGNPITIQELNESRNKEAVLSGVPFDKYFLCLTGEVFCLPRYWRQTGIDDANDEIEQLVMNSDDRVINLGQIRTAIKPDAEYTGIDDTIIWDCSDYHADIPSLVVTMPDGPHDGELMWEIHIDGMPCVDNDTAMSS